MNNFDNEKELWKRLGLSEQLKAELLRFCCIQAGCWSQHPAAGTDEGGAQPRGAFREANSVAMGSQR